MIERNVIPIVIPNKMFPNVKQVKSKLSSFISLGYDESIVKRLQEKNWNIALAYMLEEEKGRPEDALVI